MAYTLCVRIHRYGQNYVEKHDGFNAAIQLQAPGRWVYVYVASSGASVARTRRIRLGEAGEGHRGVAKR